MKGCEIPTTTIYRGRQHRKECQYVQDPGWWSHLSKRPCECRGHRLMCRLRRQCRCRRRLRLLPYPGELLRCRAGSR